MEKSHMAKGKNQNKTPVVRRERTPSVNPAPLPDETALFTRVAEIIETRKFRAGAYANREVILMYWEIGKYVGSVLLGGERAEYGKQIFSSLAKKLVEQYGKTFASRNLRRMVQFNCEFPDLEIVSPLATQLSWTHFVELLPFPSHEARMYYANDAAARHLGKLELRNQIARKAYERQEIANASLTEKSSVPFNMFKDPFLLDTLELKDNFLEADLNPKGVVNQSPGLRVFALPREDTKKKYNPKGVAHYFPAIQKAACYLHGFSFQCATPLGLTHDPQSSPGWREYARPWALIYNPLGVDNQIFLSPTPNS
ncbi:MAG: DUF1016 N-terminal domain-containing protein [Kiritimatiellaeota bacterium]|nr:DUF1016 N-terminal domain-containing protein [Kiritimatiellota bacterium]